MQEQRAECINKREMTKERTERGSMQLQVRVNAAMRFTRVEARL